MERPHDCAFRHVIVLGSVDLCVVSQRGECATSIKKDRSPDRLSACVPDGYGGDSLSARCETSGSQRIEVATLQRQIKILPLGLGKTLAIACFVTILATRGAVADESQNVPHRWRHDFEKARAEAKRLDRPLLIHFYADWCIPCKRMEREVLNDAKLLKQFGSKFVAVRINADKHEELLQRFKIQSLPSDVFIAPDGRILEKASGFQSRPLYLLRLELVDAKFTKLTQSTPAGRPMNEPPSSTGSESNTEKENRRARIVARPTSQTQTLPGKGIAGGVTITAPKPLVGLDGFSPVSLFNQRKWHKGQQAFSAGYQGIQYHLASAREMQEFRAKPSRYAPRLLGCDPVVLQETDRALTGSTRHAAYFDGALYLFVSAKTRLQFKQRPLQYTRTRHVLWPEAAEPTQHR